MSRFILYIIFLILLGIGFFTVGLVKGYFERRKLRKDKSFPYDHLIQVPLSECTYTLENSEPGAFLDINQLESIVESTNSPNINAIVHYNKVVSGKNMEFQSEPIPISIIESVKSKYREVTIYWNSRSYAYCFDVSKKLDS